MGHDDLFSALSKYGGSQGAENYLTEAFRYLLRYLFEHEPTVAVLILNNLCDSPGRFVSQEAPETKVETQQAIPTGRIPDVMITAPGKRVYVEVKYDSPPDPAKLKDYRQVLERCDEPFKRLVLLTRWATDIAPGPNGPHLCRRWRQVHTWLTDLLRKGLPSDPIPRYLATEFVSFLEARHMSIERVSWELAPGVVALSDFMAMLDQAIERAGLKDKKSKKSSVGTNYNGWMIETPKYWCGISYERPLYLYFQVCDCPSAVKEHLKKTSGQDPEKYDGGFYLYLEDESTCFFSLSKERQLVTLTDFIRQCYDRVKEAEKAVGQAGQGG